LGGGGERRDVHCVSGRPDRDVAKGREGGFILEKGGGMARKKGEKRLNRKKGRDKKGSIGKRSWGWDGGDRR